MYPAGAGGMQWSAGGVDRRSMAHDFATSNSLVYRHATGLAPVQPGMAPPGAQPQMVSAGQRVPFPGLPATAAAAAARPIQPGQPRTDMFVAQQQQQQQQLAAMTRPGPSAAGASQLGQPGYVVIPQQAGNFYPMPPRHTSAPLPFPNTVDMGAMVPVGGVPVISPASTMLSPGTHSPGPPTTSNLTMQSPAHPQANVPSPGSVPNTPGNPGSAGPSVRMGSSEEQAYLEKWKQLQKYVEPLKRMINKIDKDEDREVDLIKMKNLLNILSDSSKRLPMQTLLKLNKFWRNWISQTNSRRWLVQVSTFVSRCSMPLPLTSSRRC